MLLRMMGLLMLLFYLGELSQLDSGHNQIFCFLLTTSRGKVFVYTGILPICQDEDGLAAVLGHEIAHVIARHPAERMSTSFLTLGTVFLVSLLFDVSGQLSSMLVNLMWSLPNSRTQEAEADNIGLIMMSKACYNPEAAVRLWHRMQQQEKGAPPQFMSTHPSSYNREEAIRGWLERAKSVYVENGCGEIGGFCEYSLPCSYAIEHLMVVVVI